MKTKRFMGQHFLVSDVIKGMIFETIEKHVPPARSILEVGPGGGSITEGISGLGKPLVALEKDEKYVERLLEKYDKMVVLESDAARFDLRTLDEEMVPLLIVGNLPYYAATDIILNLLSTPSRISSAHFMVQHEVALKFSSDAGDECYSKYAIWAKAFYEAGYDFKVSRKAFDPPPKVLSAFMTFSPLKEPHVDGKECREFYRFCTRMFLHPRKKFLSNFEGNEKQIVLEIMGENGLKEDVRPGVMPAGVFEALFRILQGERT